jgi:hypothetical protein
MVLLADGFLHHKLVLGINILCFEIKVQFVVFFILLDHFGSLHVKTNWQNSMQGEIRVINVVSVYLIVLIKQIGIFEFFNWLMGDFANPIVDS